MSIFTELKRRNVFRVGLLYIVAAGFILQISDMLFTRLGLPAWTFRFVFTLLLICFPLVLVFSWVCEITPEGLKREQDIEPEDSITTRTGQKISHITLVLLVLALLAVIVDILIPESTATRASLSTMNQKEQTFATSGSVLETGQTSVELQAHRGGRGLLPENSIPAFLHALDLGVSTLEMDVAINAQGHVVVSHEAWMSAMICAHQDGREVTREEEKSLRLYAMSDEEVTRFDCGSRGHPDYPRQQAMSISKPLLGDVLKAVAIHTEATDRNASLGQVLFNIEIKSLPEGDRVFHPVVIEFANALHRVLNKHHVVEQTTVQSFDVRALEAMHEINPQISISLLVENKHGLQQNLARLSFIPQIYSPDHVLLDRAEIDAAHAQNIRVIPWTVNDEKTMRELVEMGVDGLITDYPDLGLEVLAEIEQDR